MTPQERKVMELALDFISRLQFADAEPEPERVMETIKKALDRIDAAPVAKNESGRITWLVNDWPQNCLLYTTPPQPKEPKQEQDEPVAVVTGVYGGRFTYAPIKASVILPVGMALYTRPQPLTSRNDVLEEVAKKFDRMTSLGDTAASFACYVRGMKG